MPSAPPADAGLKHVDALPAQTQRYQEKREAILDAAARLFNQKGVKGGTLSDVGRSVGLITNSVTYYYRKKEDLAKACFLRAIEAMNGVISQAMSASTPELRVREFLSCYVSLLAAIVEGRHPDIVNFNDIRALTSPHLEVLFQAYTDMFRRVRGLLHSPERAGERRQLNAQAHLLLSLTLWSRAWVREYEVEDYGRAAERAGDILLRGIAAPRSDWTGACLPDAAWSAPAGSAARMPEAFLRAATYLVNEQGYRGASVDKISARLKVTKGSFYHHNDHKEDLIIECFERTFAVVRRIQTAAAGSAPDGWGRLCAALNTLVRHQLSEQGPLLRASAWSALPVDLRYDKLRSMNRLTARFANFIVDGIEDGSIRPVDQTIAAHMVTGTINSATELERWVPGVTRDSAAELYARPLLTGLLAV